MTRAIIWGFGALGRALAVAAAEIGGIEIVGIIDNSPALVGKPLGDVLVGAGSDRSIVATLDECAGSSAEILFHATTTDAEPVTQQVLAGLAAGYTVISAAEWMYNAWFRYESAALAIDRAARAKGRHALGCGINPGLAFESLPLLLLKSLRTIDFVDIKRTPNASGIGPGDFAHVGFGLSADAFRQRWEAEEIHGHIGFPESIAAVAEAARLRIDTIVETLTPTLCVDPIDLGYTTIQRDQVVGITQEAVGRLGSKPVIRMTLDAFVDPAAYGRIVEELITIEGSRHFKASIRPAASPVDGAAAIMIRDALAVEALPFGLVSQLDLPMGGARRTHDLRALSSSRANGAMTIAVGSSG